MIWSWYFKTVSILLANDDGIQARGLRALVEAFQGLDEVYVVAPDRERNASSHSLTLHRPLRIKPVAEREFAIDGMPTDCVLLAVKKLMPERPRLLVSGINHGANLGDDVTYSGTVSAALEGAILGIPSIAVSLVGTKVFHFDLAARFARSLAEKVLERGLPSGIYLNVNVPGDLVGFLKNDHTPIPFEMTHLGKRDYGNNIVVEKIDPRERKYYWIGGEPNGFERIPGTDCDTVLKHAISVTPLRADLTHYQFLEELRHWDLNGFRHRAPETA